MWNLNLSFLDGDEEQQGSLLGESDGPCSLSPLQRIYGFAASVVAGLAFMLLSLIVFTRPIKFAVMFCLGNILAVGSTAFLIGPGQQIRMMLDSARIYATAIYIGSLFLALISALWIHNKVLTLLAMIIEICALICLAFSFAPFLAALLVLNGWMQSMVSSPLLFCPVSREHGSMESPVTRDPSILEMWFPLFRLQPTYQESRRAKSILMH